MTDIKTFLAQADPIGKVVVPVPGGISPTGQLTGIASLLNSLLKIIIIAAGIMVFLNLVLAGFAFISAGGDPKAISKAWERIWQSLLGLLIIVSSFLFAAIIGWIFFRNPQAILNPTITR